MAAYPSRRARPRRGTLWVALVIAAVLAGVAAWAALAQRQPSAHPPSPSSPVAAPTMPPDAFRVVAGYVFDGDTLEATVDDAGAAFPRGATLRVRLIGIDTPEGRPPECWADEARDRLRALAPEGAPLWAAVDRDLFDRYERALLYLWTADGRFVNLELVAAGDAEALRVEPNVTHADVFAAAEASARSQSLGQWGTCG